MSGNEWLSELKEGDPVIIRGTNRKDRIATVERVTPTMIRAGGERFNRRGSKTGEKGYHCTCLENASPEAMTRAKQQIVFARVVGYLASFNRRYDDLTLSQWERIEAIIHEAKEGAV